MRTQIYNFAVPPSNVKHPHQVLLVIALKEALLFWNTYGTASTTTHIFVAPYIRLPIQYTLSIFIIVCIVPLRPASIKW